MGTKDPLYFKEPEGGELELTDKSYTKMDLYLILR